MRRWISLVLVPLLGLASAQALACFTVFDRENRLVYQSERPPVDMSRPLHETVPSRFGPGSHMIFDGNECTAINSLAIGNGGRTPAISPLLTNEKAARERRLRHSSLGNGIALVQGSDAIMRPGLTVFPADTAVAGAPDTRALGAPRAPSRPVTKTTR